MGFLNWWKYKWYEGGHIIKTLGSIDVKRGFVKTEIVVHAIEQKNGEMAIGLQLISKSLLSYELVPITLTFENCRCLQELLNKALNS
jgi:hypothetical protein